MLDPDALMQLWDDLGVPPLLDQIDLPYDILSDAKLVYGELSDDEDS